MKAHVLVVDDDPRITDLLRRVVAYEGYSVAIAISGDEALLRTLECAPDIIILDIMLPHVNGLDVVQRLRAAGDNVPILLPTARDSVADRVKGLEVGADDYLVKPFVPEELLARIKALLRRNKNERQEILHYLDLQLDTGTRVAYRAGREIELSPTEYELLSLFMRRPRQAGCHVCLPEDKMVSRHHFLLEVNPPHARLRDSDSCDLFYFLREYCAGDSMTDLMKQQRGSRLSLDEAMPLLLQTLTGLAEVHTQGLVHRDLKPQNILLAGREGQY